MVKVDAYLLRPYNGPRQHLGPYPKRKKNKVCIREHPRIPENIVPSNGNCKLCKKLIKKLKREGKW